MVLVPVFQGNGTELFHQDPCSYFWLAETAATRRGDLQYHAFSTCHTDIFLLPMHAGLFRYWSITKRCTSHRNRKVYVARQETRQTIFETEHKYCLAQVPIWQWQCQQFNIQHITSTFISSYFHVTSVGTREERLTESHCSSFGWNRLNFLHISSYGTVSWICNQNCWYCTDVFAVAEQCLHSEGLLCFSHFPTSR